MAFTASRIFTLKRVIFISGIQFLAVSKHLNNIFK